MCRDGAGAVQLVERDDVREGRVEICSNGVWGAVCTNNDVDMNAACPMTGYAKYGGKYNYYYINYHSNETLFTTFMMQVH